MFANRSIDNEGFLPALLLNLLIISCFIVWAILPPSHLVSIFLFATLILIALMGLRKVSKQFPLILFLIFGIIFTLGVGSPDWDARSIWLFHAKRIYFENNLYAQLDNYAPWSHNDYPVIFSVLAATLAKAVGHWNEVFPKSVLIFFLIPPLLICSALLKQKILIVLFIAGIGVICRNYLFNGYMDALVAIYTCAIILIIMKTNDIKVDSSSGYIYLTLILISFFLILILLKNEGLVISITILFLTFFLQRNIPKFYILVITITTFAIYFILWKLPVLEAHIETDLIASGIHLRALERLNSYDDLQLIFSKFLKYSGLYFGIFLLNFFRKTVRWKNLVLPTIFVIIYSGILFFVYLSTPFDLAWHLGTSVKRALLPIIVVLLGTFLYSFVDPTKNLKKEL